VPELKAVLPPTAIGKDFPYHGAWLGRTPSGTGLFVSLGGYLGLTVGWVEGIELNFFGGVLGLDLRRPALKFPGILGPDRAKVLSARDELHTKPPALRSSHSAVIRVTNRARKIQWAIRVCGSAGSPNGPNR